MFPHIHTYEVPRNEEPETPNCSLDAALQHPTALGVVPRMGQMQKKKLPHRGINTIKSKPVIVIQKQTNW